VSVRTILLIFFGKSELFGLYPTYYNMGVHFNISIRERTTLPPPPPAGVAGRMSPKN
jgi:hypothetical protein